MPLFLIFLIKQIVYSKCVSLPTFSYKQSCNFTIGTTYPASGTIKFTFHSDSGGYNYGQDTRSTDDFLLSIEKIENANMDNSTTTFGFTIKMSRLLQPFIMECYLPCIAIVIVTLISFLIPLDAVPGRVALLVTQFLTLTNICIYQQVKFVTCLSY